MAKIPVVIVGGGMITQMQILPSIYQLQRLGAVGDIAVSALNGAPLKVLDEDPLLRQAFPGQTFTPYPDFRKVGVSQNYPELFKEVLAGLPGRSAVVVALPDQLHYGAVKEALNAGHHVCCVKPLVLRHRQAVEIEELAHGRGLLVGIEYHKRFDDRSLLARRRADFQGRAAGGARDHRRVVADFEKIYRPGDRRKGVRRTGKRAQDGSADRIYAPDDRRYRGKNTLLRSTAQTRTGGVTQRTLTVRAV